MSRVIAVFGSSAAVEGHAAYRRGVHLGRLLAEAGFVVATGGYGGTMEAVSRGAAEAGGVVVGVIAPAVFPTRVAANAYVAEERHAPTIARRICSLVDDSDGSVVLPGSLGTATELMVAWNDVFVSTGARPHKPLVAVTGHWRPLVELLAGTYGADPSGITLVDTPAEAVETLSAAFEMPERRGIVGT